MAIKSIMLLKSKISIIVEEDLKVVIKSKSEPSMVAVKAG